MIFVTLGTQDKPFDRLLKAIDREITKGNIKDEVIVQAGFTKYKSKNMKILNLIDRDKFEKLITDCDLLITHGGVGSIMTGLYHNKTIISVPRLSKYGEHVNDHQIQIINNFNDKGYIIGLQDLNKLNDALIKAKTFKPIKYKSNTKNMIKLISEYIDNN